MENQIIKGMFFILRDKQKLEYMLDKNFVKLKHNYAYFILATRKLTTLQIICSFKSYLVSYKVSMHLT